MSFKYDKRLFKTLARDMVMVYVGRHPTPIPFRHARLLGPMSLTPEEVKDVPLNGSVEDDVSLFPITAKDQLLELMGAAPDDRREVSFSSSLGQCTFVLPTVEQTAWGVVPTPFLHSHMVIPWAAIKATVFDSLLNLPLFETSRVGESGVLEFKFIGKKPLSTTITGAINMFLPVANNESHISRTLSILPVRGLPSAAIGQGFMGQTFLATYNGAFADEPRWLNQPSEFLKYPLNTPTKAMITKLRGEENKNLFTGFQVGGFTQITTNTLDKFDPEKLYSDDNLSDEENANLKTTNWFNCDGGDVYWVAPVLETQYSTRCRMQYRKQGSKTIYFEELGNVSDGYFRFPKDAVSARIHYCGGNDTVTNLYIKNRTVLGEMDGIDPASGWWQEVNFHVNKPYVFWPGTTYAIGIHTDPSVDGEVTPIAVDRVWYNGGGLSLLFNAKAYLMDLAEKLGFFDPDGDF